MGSAYTRVYPRQSSLVWGTRSRSRWPGSQQHGSVPSCHTQPDGDVGWGPGTAPAAPGHHAPRLAPVPGASPPSSFPCHDLPKFGARPRLSPHTQEVPGAGFSIIKCLQKIMTPLRRAGGRCGAALWEPVDHVWMKPLAMPRLPSATPAGTPGAGRAAPHASCAPCQPSSAATAGHGCPESGRHRCRRLRPVRPEMLPG